MDVLEIVVSTPIPKILIIGGLGFLLLSFADKVIGQIQVAENRKIYAMVTGFILLITGLGFEFFGASAGQAKSEVAPLVAEQKWERPLKFAPLAEASFPCSTYEAWSRDDSHPAWDVICASEQVAAADKRMSDLYRAFLESAAPVDKADIKQDQRDWLKQRDLACVTKWEDLTSRHMVKTASTCLKTIYDARVDHFTTQMKLASD